MLTVNTDKYAERIRTCMKADIPLMVYGAQGIGKSEIPTTQIFPLVAEEMERQFVDWTKTTLDEKMEMIGEPEKYYVVMDLRIAQYDPTEIRGIPNMANSEILENIPYSWIRYFTSEKAAGVIFFDEINLAPPVVSGAAYQIIHDRRISDRKLAKDVWVMAAGNRPGKDRANLFEMSEPLKDRFAEVEVVPTVKGWSAHAMKEGVNPNLIAFINWKEIYLHRNVKGDKGSTPRGLIRASKMLGNNTNIASDDAHEIIAMACGEAFATEFQAYTKCYAKLNWNKIFKDPSSVKDLTTSETWAICGGLAEIFHKDINKKDAADLFKLKLQVLENMQEDFAIISMRMMREAHPVKFKNLIRKQKDFQTIAKKYGKFLAPNE